MIFNYANIYTFAMSDIAKLTIIKTEENKRTKIPNSDESLKWQNQAQAHQTNGWNQSYSWFGTGFSYSLEGTTLLQSLTDVILLFGIS